MTMNDHWGYNQADQNFKSTETLIHNLIDCASKGGNYLLNVGPTSLGVIPAPELERLKEIGDWMNVNSVAIYATSASPFKKLPWGRCTEKVAGENTILYLHVWNWPTDGKLLVPGLSNTIKSAKLLATGEKLKTSAASDGIVIEIPPTAPDPISSTIVLKLKGAPEIEATTLRQSADGSIMLAAANADLHGVLQYEHDNGKDNIGYWADSADYASWTVKVSQTGKFRVTTNIAARNDSNFEISINDQKISGAAPKTGDYTKFQSTRLDGLLEISAPGEVTISVKPEKDNWSPINLKSVKLIPISAGL